MAEQILIFGGSFDPIHNGHLIIAHAIAESLGVERVWLMPTGVNPLKTASPAASEHRLAMLRLAIENDELFEISEIELRRQPPSYSIDTIDELLSLGIYQSPLNMAIGADMIGELPKWHCAEELLAKVKLVIACRPPWSYKSVVEAIEKLRGQLSDKYINEIAASVIPTLLIDISSTDIRSRAAAGKPIQPLAPPAVAEYIKLNKLYQI